MLFGDNILLATNKHSCYTKYDLTKHISDVRGSSANEFQRKQSNIDTKESRVGALWTNIHCI